MISNERMLAVLDLFGLDRPEWSFEEIQSRLGFSRSTLYRYMRQLTDAGLLATIHASNYRLGPRIIEFDHLIRMTDPLIHAARPVMREIINVEPGVALLCRRYNDKVLCVHQEASTQKFLSNFERGRGRPLLRGAASLAILAHLPKAQLRRLHAERPGDFAAADLGADLAEVRDRLRTMARGGFIVSHGHVTPGVTGISAPIFEPDGDVAASLSITLPVTSLTDARAQQLGERLVFCARIVATSLV